MQFNWKWIISGAVLLPVLAFAAGFGTPVIDGQVDAVYGTPEAVDPAGDAVNWSPMDMLNMYVCNDANFLYILYTVNADLGSNSVWYGKYNVYIDVNGLPGVGATTDGWGRNVECANPHRPEYMLASWHDTPNWGAGNTQLITYNAGTSSWGGYTPLTAAARFPGTTTGVEYKIPLADIGNPDSIWVEAYSTGGGGNDNAQDTSNDPANDWNAPTGDWGTRAILANSTKVEIIRNTDVIRPQVASARASAFNQSIVVFSEPVDSAAAVNVARYTIGATHPTLVEKLSSTDFRQTWASDFTPNTQYTISVDTLITDLANNRMDPAHLSATFRSLITQTVTFQARMSNVAGHAEPVNVRGSQSPLSWGSDLVLTDPDSNEFYTGTGNFVFADSMYFEYKVRHGDNWESVSNRSVWLRATNGASYTIPVVWYDNMPDNTPPNMTSVDSVEATRIRVVFSERMDPVSAQVAGNYTFAPAGPTATAAVRIPGEWNKVWVSVNNMAANTLYTVTAANGVADLGGNPILFGTTRSATFTSPLGTPDAPTALTAAISGSDVVLSWQQAANATGYKIYRKASPYDVGLATATEIGTTTGASSTTFTVTGETVARTSAWYVVIATN